jgi:hypothetical protein
MPFDTPSTPHSFDTMRVLCAVIVAFPSHVGIIFRALGFFFCPPALLLPVFVRGLANGKE